MTDNITKNKDTLSILILFYGDGKEYLPDIKQKIMHI